MRPTCHLGYGEWYFAPVGNVQGRGRAVVSIFVVLAVAATTVGGFAAARGSATSDVLSASGRLVGGAAVSRSVGEPELSRSVGSETAVGRSVGREARIARTVGAATDLLEIEQAVAAEGVSISGVAEAEVVTAPADEPLETSPEEVTSEVLVLDETATDAPSSTGTESVDTPSEVSVVGPPLITQVSPSPSVTSTTAPSQPVVRIPVTQTPTTTPPTSGTPTTAPAAPTTATPTTRTPTTRTPATRPPTTRPTTTRPPTTTTTRVPTTRAPNDRDAPSTNAATRFEGAPQTTTTTAAPTTTTTAVPTRLSVVRVSTSGNDSNSGAAGSAVATLDRALDLVAEGGTVEFEAGTYAPLRLIGVNDVTIRGNGNVSFVGTGYTREAGILVQNSRDIDITGIAVRRALWGIYVAESHRVTLQNNNVSDVGQEAIRVKDASTDVVIDGNSISQTGRRSSSANGEGIYIGTGSPGGVDRVSNVSIINNQISNTTDEAIDIKDATTNIVIRGNTISNVTTRTTGAIVVHVNGSTSSNPNVTIEQNVVSGVRRDSPFRDGNCIVTHVTTRIINNVLHNCEHRGIHLAGSSGQATVLHNTLINAGSIGAIVDEGRGMNVISQNNLGASGDANRQADASMFPGASSGDYRLSASARAEFGSAPSVGVGNDLLGNGRSGSGTITFGAIE